MKQKITLILGTILFLSITQIQAQETITLDFTLNDHNGESLTGLLKVKIDVVGDGKDWEDLENIYIYHGSYDQSIDLDIEEGGIAKIMVTYYPNEDPTDEMKSRTSTPINEDSKFSFSSRMVRVKLPDTKLLSFDLSLGYEVQEIISSTKAGAEREASKSTELSETAKIYAEAGLSAWIFTAKAGGESEESESETNSTVDREMTENEESKRYQVRIPTGGLKIEGSSIIKQTD
jgi:hypothetical protein